MIELDADVLVLGGGPAGAWAALAAAGEGARVVLADKGYCGTSGPTAFGYPFAVDDDGAERRGSLQGPEYMKRMRRRVHRSGVTILDHHPALRLLVDGSGAASGASGLARQKGGEAWTVHAGAVVLATGGCAFLSGAFGTNVDTGDGHLMAAELGAELSGMEFSAAYALSPAHGAHTKGLMMQFATYSTEDGDRIDVPDPLGARIQVAELLADGRKVFARLDRAPAELRGAMRDAQPNYFLPLDKAGIDPFRDRYEVRMVLEGTVRGTGGLRITGDDCATAVPGLYAAGDVATRELVSGAASGGGAYNPASCARPTARPTRCTSRRSADRPRRAPRTPTRRPWPGRSASTAASSAGGAAARPAAAPTATTSSPNGSGPPSGIPEMTAVRGGGRLPRAVQHHPVR